MCDNDNGDSDDEGSNCNDNGDGYPCIGIDRMAQKHLLSRVFVQFPA